MKAHGASAWRRFFVPWLLGLTGVASLVLLPLPTVAPGSPMHGWDPWQLHLIVLVNPLLLLTLGAALGAGLAHRTGLGSRLAGTSQAPWALGAPALAGLALGGLVVGVDALVSQAVASPPALAVGLLYGGLAEEVMLRYGLMSLLAWAGARLWSWRGRQPPHGRLPDAVYWCAIVLSALAFAAAHLPAVLQQPDAGAWGLARSLGWNTALGVVYGALFWKRGLESAMTAHAATHVGMAALRSLLP